MLCRSWDRMIVEGARSCLPGTGAKMTVPHHSLVLAAALALSAVVPAAAADPAELLAGRSKDCAGCNVAGANLKRFDLVNANLAGANLAGANLHRANLSGADLSGADLSGANLNKSDLHGANLT